MTSQSNKTSLIYYAFCNESGKGYVGKTADFARRKYQHLSGKPPSAFHHAIAKYGKDAFEWILLESNLSENVVDERERYWIIEKATLCPDGYNIKTGGQGGLFSEAYKEKRLQEEEERIANLNKDFTQDIIECPLCGQIMPIAYNHTVKPFKPIFDPLYTCLCVFHGQVEIIFKENNQVCVY